MPKVPRSRLCLVAGCFNSKQSTVHQDAMFYPLPHEHGKRLKNWLKAISREHYSSPSKGFVCNRHFAPDAYPKGPRKILVGDNPPLRVTAVPSIFLNDGTSAEVIALSDEECEILDVTPLASRLKMERRRIQAQNRQKWELTNSKSSDGTQKERKSAQGANIAVIQTDLFMDCEEENLSAAQVKAFKRTNEEYGHAQAAVKACLKGCSGSTEDIDLTTGIKTITVYFERPATPPPPQPVPVYQINGADDDDVIVVGQTILTRDRPCVANASRVRRSPAQPLQPSPTRIVGHIQSIPSPPLLKSRSHSVLRAVLGAPAQVGPKSAKSANKVTTGSKRAAEPVAPPPAKKPNLQVDTSEMSWVPLEEFYYGKAEGNPSYAEEKGEYRFKCYCCHKMLYSNLRTMKHIQGHIDSDKQQNLDLSDLTQCKHCYKQFDTPFEMQCHVEKVHQSKSNVLVCRICEKDHDTSSGLSYHMRTFHNPCEMPYICQLCKFRSSVYSDVVDHFYKRHNSSKHMLCLYCLKIFKMNIQSHGWGLTQHYFQHLQKHQAKTRAKKCSSCKLSFISQAEVVFHKRSDHNKNNKALLASRNTPRSDQVMIQVGQGMKSLNAPALSKVLDMSRLRMHGVTKQHKCYECQAPMQAKDHYTKHMACSLCRYATTCNDSFANHMTGFHTGNAKVLKKITIKEKPSTELFCSCGYSSCYGNQIANHLTLCAKSNSTCSFAKPKKQQPTPTTSLDVPSLFGALGLVKKSSSRVAHAGQSKSTKDVSHDVINQMLDKVSSVEDEVKTEVDGDSLSLAHRSSISILSPMKDKRGASVIGQVTIKEEESEDAENEPVSENLASNDLEGISEERAGEGQAMTNEGQEKNAEGQEKNKDRDMTDQGPEMTNEGQEKNEESSRVNEIEPEKSSTDLGEIQMDESLKACQKLAPNL